MRSGISAIETKAAPGDNLTNITFLRYDAATSVTDYTTPTVLSGATLTDGAIAFASPQYYNKDGDKSFFIGYHPAPDVTSDNNTANFTIDGTKDIIATNIFDAGTRLSPVTSPITFNHLLSQIDIKIVAPTNDDINYFGGITSVKIVEQPNTCVLTCEAAPSLSTTSGSEEFTVASISPSSPVTLTTTAASCGTFMIVPREGTLNTETSKKEVTLKLKIATANTAEQEVAVTLSSRSADTYAIPAGQKSTITLTFKQKGISGSGAISAWGEEGGTGSEEIN